MKLKPRLKGVSDVARGKSGRPKWVKPKDRPNQERLVYTAIIRGNQTHAGCRSHMDLRRQFGDEMPHQSMPGDIEGFYTSHNRFVTRIEAQDVALLAGQIPQRMERDLLSSDINWDA